MTGRRSSRSQLRLLRALTAFALVWPGALLAAAFDGSHPSADRHAEVGRLATTAPRAGAVDFDGPVAALPGSTADLAGSGRADRPVSRIDASGTPRQPGPLAFARWSHCVPPRALPDPVAPASREPTLACGFVSSRPTAPPAFRS